MYKLYIDTHLEVITIILLKDDKIIVKKELVSSLNHSVNVMPLLDLVLKENNIKINDIKELMVVNGPGSFTAVRIGVSIAKTLAYILDIPIKVISSLMLLALSVEDKDKIVAIKEKNGKYIAKFNKNNILEGNYYYLSNKEYEEYKKNKKIEEDIKIDYLKVFEYLKNKEVTNVHEVNPVYVKDIEVANG